MKNFNNMVVHQFLGEEGRKKTTYRGNCLKRRDLGPFVGRLAKKREEGVFEGEKVNTPTCIFQ